MLGYSFVFTALACLAACSGGITRGQPQTISSPSSDGGVACEPPADGGVPCGSGGCSPADGGVAGCGDGICEPGETHASCPLDCCDDGSAGGSGSM